MHITSILRIVTMKAITGRYTSHVVYVLSHWKQSQVDAHHKYFTYCHIQSNHR